MSDKNNINISDDSLEKVSGGKIQPINSNAILKYQLKNALIIPQK